MPVLRHCHECRGSGEMGLDRGQWTEYVRCHYCQGTGDFQERRKRVRRADDQGAVASVEAILTHARLDASERGIAEAERYIGLAEDALTHLRGQ